MPLKASSFSETCPVQPPCRRRWPCDCSLISLALFIFWSMRPFYTVETYMHYTHSTTSSLCCLFSSALHCYLLPVTVFPTCSPYLVDRGYFSFAAAQIILRDRIIIGIEHIDFEFISSFASIPFLPAESLSVLFLILWVPLTTLVSPRPSSFRVFGVSRLVTIVS